MATAVRRSVALLGERISQISSKFVLPEKLKGGRIEQGGLWTHEISILSRCPPQQRRSLDAVQ